MQVEATAKPAVKIVTANKHKDVPELFSEIDNTCAFDESGFDYSSGKDNYFSPSIRRPLPRTSPPGELKRPNFRPWLACWVRPWLAEVGNVSAFNP